LKGNSGKNTIKLETWNPFYHFVGRWKTQVYAEQSLTGYYHATNPNPMAPGYWMPSLGFDVDNTSVNWGFSLNESAQVKPPVNLGTKANPVPFVVIRATATIGTIFWSSTNHTDFSARGTTGFWWGDGS
jgi:hypothetical protein